MGYNFFYKPTGLLLLINYNNDAVESYGLLGDVFISCLGMQSIHLYASDVMLQVVSDEETNSSKS